MSLPFNPSNGYYDSVRLFEGRDLTRYKNSLNLRDQENGFKSRGSGSKGRSEMVDLEITYCQPCGHQPRAVDMVSQLLATYGMPLNRKLSIALKPADKGVFDVVLDGKLIFSKNQTGRFPTVDEIKQQLDSKVIVPLETPTQPTM